MPTDPPPPPSLLDTLGVEITAVMTPVSICMLVVVLLVTALAPPPSSSSSSAAASPVTAANLVYAELPSDSPAHKLAGALLNAALFVALVTAATFLLLLLYYYNFTSCLRNYMRFSAFFVLASMGGSLLLQLLRNSHLPLDSVTVLTLLLNASVLGVLSVFSPAVPIIMRQSYTVLLGVITAAWFTRLPEWTTWTLLLALALYDLVAVLAPRGPLRMLVELASSREDDLPALVYEARPTGAPAPVHPLATFASPNSIELQPRGHSVVEIEEAEAEVETETARLVPDGDDDEMEMFDSSRGIRLGLGDFVFYSVLVGRAAMYDLMTVYACYLAIIAGLGCTLILLAVCRKALPALPISITLGVVFYFLTRLLMEPFVVGVATSLVMF